MPDDKSESVAKALELLGAAWRGDWSDFDGRTLRHQLDELASALRSDVPLDIEGWAWSNDICPVARSWSEHCRDRSEGHRSCDHARAYYEASVRTL